MRERYINICHGVLPETHTVFEPTIEGAINVAKNYGEPGGGQVFITGSLHLVGGALRVLDPVH